MRPDRGLLPLSDHRFILIFSPPFFPPFSIERMVNSVIEPINFDGTVYRSRGILLQVTVMKIHRLDGFKSGLFAGWKINYWIPISIKIASSFCCANIFRIADVVKSIANGRRKV